jgi:hypothetical protein
MTPSSIPLGDASALRRFTTRTQLVRGGLAAAILLLGLLAVLFARTSSNRNAPLLSAGSDGIVVLDMSASASANEYADIQRYLEDLIKTHGRFGLVLFSDTGYEALPPNAPATELTTLLPYFKPPYPASPWAAGFSLGTSISKGLEAASNVLLSDGVKRRDVWLISDLSDSPTDRAQLAPTLRSYVTYGISLHVLPVEATQRDIAPYRRLFGPPSPTVRVKPLPITPPQAASYAFPLSLAILAALLAFTLGLNELASTPLRWGRAALEVTE